MPIQTGLPARLTWIDDTNRRDHSFLAEEDRCAFFGELQASTGWGGGATNQLIANYKRSPAQIGHEPSGERLRRHRERAINEVAAALRGQFSREEVELRCTFVPIPTSKQPGHPEYCDRLERSLRLAFTGYRADIRPLLRLTASTRADHLSADERLRYQHLLAVTRVAPNRSIDTALIKSDDPLYKRDITFLNLVLLHLFYQGSLGMRIAGHDQQAGGITIQAMHYARS